VEAYIHDQGLYLPNGTHGDQHELDWDHYRSWK
jgi:hypothetical protein